LNNSADIIDNILNKKYYSWIPTLGLTLDPMKFTSEIRFDPYNKTKIIDISEENSSVKKFKIATISFDDTLDNKQKKDLEFFTFNISFLHDNKIEKGNIKAVINNNENEFLLNAKFKILDTGFIEIIITEFIYTSKELLDADYFINILYTIIKLTKHEDAHHQQKVDDIMGVYLDDKIDSSTYKIKLLERQIQYLKKIENFIKRDLDRTKFGFDYGNIETSILIDKSARFEGFVSYFNAYLTKLQESDFTNARKSKDEYKETVNAIKLSVNSLKSRIESGKNNYKFSTILTTGVAITISASILMTNFIKIDKVSPTFEILLIPILLGILVIILAYGKDIYYTIANKPYSQEIKYAIPLKRYYPKDYKKLVDWKTKLLIWIINNGTFLSFIIGGIFIFYHIGTSS